MSFLNSKHGINPKQAIEAADNQRKAPTLNSAFKDLGGAGNYAVIFPVANYGTEQEPFYSVITAKSTVASIDLTIDNHKKFGTIVYTEDMLEPRVDINDPPIDKTKLKGLRRICALFRLGQMEEKIQETRDKFAKQTNVSEVELENEIRLIRSKYIYDSTLKTKLVKDILGRPRDISGTLCYVIQLDNNNKPFRNSDGSLDTSKCRVASYVLSPTRTKEFIDSLKVPNSFKPMGEIDGTPIYAAETLVVYKGAANPDEAAEAMRTLKFNILQIGRLIDNELDCKVINDHLVYKPDNIYHKSAALSKGWSEAKVDSEIRAFLSKNQVYMTYAKTDTDAFKYAAKYIVENENIFERIKDNTVIQEAKKQVGQVTEVAQETKERDDSITAQKNDTEVENYNTGEDLFTM